MGDLKKLLKLLKNNKEEKCFIMDDLGKTSYVLMSIDAYEKLTGSDLTDDRILSKINREIAYWKEVENQENDSIEIEDEDDYDEDEKLYFESVED